MVASRYPMPPGKTLYAARVYLPVKERRSTR